MKLKLYALLTVFFCQINLFGQVSYPSISSTEKGESNYNVSTAKNVGKSFNATSSHLNFDGTDDYVVLTHFEKPAAFTFEAMIKTNTTSNEACMLSWLDDGLDTGIYNDNTWISISQGKLLFRVNSYIAGGGCVSCDIIVGNTTINDGVWHHIAVVKTNDVYNNVLLYVDGVLDAIGTDDMNIDNVSGSLFLGATGVIAFEPPFTNPTTPTNPNKYKSETREILNNYTPVGFFQGDLDEVRVWNRALSLAELQNNQNCELATPTNQTGLIAYYQFNQGIDSNDNSTVTTVTDASSNGYNGTLTNFTLNGTTSNWIAGSPVVTGNNCAPFLSNASFELKHQLKLYPNPTNNQITIQFESLTNPQLQVIDINGRVLLNQSLAHTTNIVNIATLPSGIYLFKIISKEGIGINRVIKN